MCIRDRLKSYEADLYVKGLVKITQSPKKILGEEIGTMNGCLLYTSDAADERSSVDLGGRRIIKKKNRRETGGRSIENKIKIRNEKR